MPPLSTLFAQLRRYLLLVFAAMLLVAWLLAAPVNFTTAEPLSISKGETLSEISHSLQERGLIQSTLLFNFLARVTGASDNLKAGDYWFERRLNAFELFQRLREGRFVANPIKLSIPEGLNAAQIAKLVHDKFPAIYEAELVRLIGDRVAEVLPETYFVSPQITAPWLVLTWQKAFAERMEPLRRQAAEQGQDWQEVLILASIVEEEVTDKVDRRLVAGVLWKRLEIGMPLQVDVAKETYQRRGLPDRPIANVSYDAIDAVLNPTRSDYLYYLSDATGKTHFGETFDQHKLNRQKYLTKNI